MRVSLAIEAQPISRAVRTAETYRFRHMLTISDSILRTPGKTSGWRGLLTTKRDMALLMMAFSSSPPWISSQPVIDADAGGYHSHGILSR
jgi:hypothetical protein